MFKDHLTSIQRDNLNKLTKCSRKLNAIAKRVIEIQRYLELERLKSSDDDNSTSDGIIAFPIDGGIRKKVGILSSDLDWLASRIDSVATKHNDAQSTEEIILTKKALSRRTVKLMNYVDELMEILLEADKSFRALKNEASVFYTHTQT